MDEVGTVARELRAARENLGLTREQLAEKIGYTASYIEKIETGKLPVTEPYLAAALKVLAEGVDATGLFGRMRQDEQRQRAVPDWFRPWRDHEQEATEIRYYEPLLVPGLLQTEEYARALLADDARVAVRMERQQVLDRATLTAIIEESVLRREIGNRAVMADQLAVLAESRAVVHVLPIRAGTYLGTLGMFALALIDSTEVAYADTPLHGLVEAGAEVVSGVRRRWEVLASEALPRSLSRDLILKEAERWKSESA